MAFRDVSIMPFWPSDKLRASQGTKELWSCKSICIFSEIRDQQLSGNRDKCSDQITWQGYLVQPSNTFPQLPSLDMF